ncbi:hypothetical protein L7F22_034904 [Adiantum nelumboides]|nr:hypothetical protein [Adiantum nelumboides]
MAELVAKAKQAKSDRQQVKERDEALRRRLDDELGDIRGLLNAAAAAPPPPPAMEVDAAAEAGSANKDVKEKEKEKDQYDAFVRELAFERRAQPQDRLKTEEEAAQELAERLRMAEEARLRRMRGLDDDDDDEDGDGRGKARRGKRKRPAGGDDLEDDFDLDGQTAADAYGLGLGLGLRAGEQDDESDGAEEDEEEGQEGDEEEEEEGDEEEEEEEEHDDFGDMADLEAMAQPGEDVELAEEKATQKKAGLQKTAGAQKKTGKDKDLPFTFACPTSHEALLATLARSGATTAAELHTVVKRIRALHHASLDRDNKLRLQALLGVLLDHALFCAGDGHFEHVNALVPHIYALSKTNARISAEQLGEVGPAAERVAEDAVLDAVECVACPEDELLHLVVQKVAGEKAVAGKGLVEDALLVQLAQVHLAVLFCQLGVWMRVKQPLTSLKRSVGAPARTPS